MTAPRARQLHLNAFLMNAGHHDAAWRHPRTQPERVTDLRYFQHLAQTAERGRLDSVFLADGLALWGKVRHNALGGFEPLTLLSALAAVTEHVGLIATVSTTFNEPFHTARKFASLDHISGGRAGWNIVTSGTVNEARNFGQDEHLEHALRYERAREFVEVATKLWDTWEDDAILLDREHGVYADTDKVREINHRGEYFGVQGPLNVPRSPQGYPLLVQAGSSEDGKEFAAQYAEAVFTAQQTLAEGQAFYKDLKSRLARYGRTGDQLLVLPGIAPVIGSTEAEARSLEQELTDLQVPEYGLAQLSGMLGTDLTGLPLDGPLPELPDERDINGNKSRFTLVAELARRDGLTLRELIARLGGGRGHRVFAGTPEQVADEIEEWFTEGAADGFNIMPPHLPGGLEDRRPRRADPAAARSVPRRVHRPHPARELRPGPSRQPTGTGRHRRGSGRRMTGLDLTADVLVIGGGPAATWAALKAAQDGADVVLADKGYCGTSGATASAGTGVWYVPPEPAAREAAMASREALGGYLADRRWMARVLDQTYAGVNELAAEGRYPFPTGADGKQLRNGLQGPEYMRRMRVRVQRSGARVLDHSPVTELLTDPSGAVAGARGHRRQAGQPYRVRAGAVVLATGGCAFLSGALGCNVNTGDGALFAAEAGAELSGMEFSNAYGIAPEGTSVTKTAFYSFATFYHEDGTVLEGAASQGGRSVIARALLSEKVYCRLDRADAAARQAMRLAQPNFFLTFDRLGIDPFTQRFAVTLLAEGTVRGTGGIRITGDDCSTTVPGLYAAGDAATRELICGGFTGGGSHNAAWAISSGTWAGRGAARHARSLGARAATRHLVAAGGAGLRPTGAAGPADGFRDVVTAVQAEVLPYEKNYLRHGDRLTASLEVLDSVWEQSRTSLYAEGRDTVGARQAAAMVAHARWMYAAALARTETRGMAKRLDFPTQDPSRHHRLTTGGLDRVWTRVESLTNAPAASAAPLEVAS